jgi:curved DNA-binding protein CbpA
MATERDPYRVLGVDPSADPTVIAGAYRALARRHHPDVSRNADAEHRMAEINAAWAILRDPERRQAWDTDHAGSQATPTTTATVRSGAVAQRPAGPVAWRRGPNGEGAAGPPPGRAGGTVLPFGRHIGWSLLEIARTDPGYLAWLAERREGQPYRAEITALLASMRGRGGSGAAGPTRDAPKRRGILRR